MRYVEFRYKRDPMSGHHVLEHGGREMVVSCPVLYRTRTGSWTYAWVDDASEPRLWHRWMAQTCLINHLSGQSKAAAQRIRDRMAAEVRPET